MNFGNAFEDLLPPNDLFFEEKENDELLWDGTPEEAIERLEQLCPSWELGRIGGNSALTLLRKIYEIQQGEGVPQSLKEERKSLCCSESENARSIRQNLSSLPALHLTVEKKQNEKLISNFRLNKEELNNTFVSFCLQDAFHPHSSSTSLGVGPKPEEKHFPFCSHPEFCLSESNLRTFICCNINRFQSDPHTYITEGVLEEPLVGNLKNMCIPSSSSPAPLYRSPFSCTDFSSCSPPALRSSCGIDSLHASVLDTTIGSGIRESVKAEEKPADYIYQPVVESLCCSDVQNPGWRAEQLEKLVITNQTGARRDICSFSGSCSPGGKMEQADFSSKSRRATQDGAGTTSSSLCDHPSLTSVEMFSVELERRLNAVLCLEFSFRWRSRAFRRRALASKIIKANNENSSGDKYSDEGTSSAASSEFFFEAGAAATAFVRTGIPSTEAGTTKTKSGIDISEADPVVSSSEEMQSNDRTSIFIDPHLPLCSKACLEVIIFSRRRLEFPYCCSRCSPHRNSEGMKNCFLNCENKNSSKDSCLRAGGSALHHSLAVGHVFFLQWDADDFLITHEYAWLLTCHKKPLFQHDFDDTAFSVPSSPRLIGDEVEFHSDNYEHTLCATEHLRSRSSPLHYHSHTKTRYDCAIIREVVNDIIYRMTAVEDKVLSTSLPFHQRISRISKGFTEW